MRRDADASDNSAGKTVNNTAKSIAEYDFTSLVRQMAAAGQQMTALQAAEASAGNLSIFVRRLKDLDPAFRRRERISLPVAVPGLAEGWVLITAAGKRLRDIAGDPAGTVCLLEIESGGETAQFYAGTRLRPTSEANTHLAVHDRLVGHYGWAYHAILHAQPPAITYLSHIERYADPLELNRRLMRWEAETLINFPEGIWMIPYLMPGSAELMEATRAAMALHRLVVWQRHGVVARSDESLIKAADLVEYTETAARYEYMNLQAGEPSAGLPEDELRRIFATYCKGDFPFDRIAAGR